ncbi:MAG: hypothetical protein JNM74_17645 [Myxococcales bacterium]|jgi:hypothetical protein|nr:hypothetical protein [Myxococcales bacterium]
MKPTRTTLALIRSSAIVLATLACAVGVVPGCGLENALVGGACKVGYTACGTDCVDVLVTREHCGSCDVVCPPGVACVAGVCGGSTDGSTDALADTSTDGNPGDARLDALADTSTDGNPGDGSTDGNPGDGSTDGNPGDGSTDGNPGDGATDGSVDACPPPPYNTPARCGSCFVQCVAPNTECLLENGNFVCKPPCTPPLEPCNGICVDKMVDPFNCGVCNKVCPALICAGGICQGTNPGHEIVVGHDGLSALGASAQAKVITNAVLLPAANPLRILSFEKWSDPAVVAKVKSLVGAAALGRTLAYTVSMDEADLRDALKLSRADVVVVYDQGQMDAAAAMSTGMGWAAPLLTFAREGKTIVALDGADGQGQMPLLLRTAGILNVTSHTALAAAQRVRVVAPADPVGLAVLSPYAVADRSVTLQSADPNGGDITYVVRQGAAGNGDPVAVHKLVQP